MLHTRCEHQQVSDTERILLTECLKDDLAFEDVDADRPIGVVFGESTAWR